MHEAWNTELFLARSSLIFGIIKFRFVHLELLLNELKIEIGIMYFIIIKVSINAW